MAKKVSKCSFSNLLKYIVASCFCVLAIGLGLLLSHDRIAQYFGPKNIVKSNIWIGKGLNYEDIVDLDTKGFVVIKDSENGRQRATKIQKNVERFIFKSVKYGKAVDALIAIHTECPPTPLRIDVKCKMRCRFKSLFFKNGCFESGAEKVLNKRSSYLQNIVKMDKKNAKSLFLYTKTDALMCKNVDKFFDLLKNKNFAKHDIVSDLEKFGGSGATYIINLPQRKLVFHIYGTQIKKLGTQIAPQDQDWNVTIDDYENLPINIKNIVDAVESQFELESKKKL